MAEAQANLTERIGAAFAALAALVAMALPQFMPVLAVPRACSALPELTTFWLTRLTPAVPLSNWIRGIDGVLVVLGVVLATRVAQKAAGHTLAGTAIGVALAFWASSSPEFTLLGHAGLLAAAGVLRQLAIPSRPGCRDDLRRWLALTMAALMWPALTLPCVVVFVVAEGASRQRRLLPFVLAGAVLVVAPGSAVYAASRLLQTPTQVSACLTPDGTGALLSHATSGLGAAGPYVCALAALGLFAHRRRVFTKAGLPVALFVVGTLIIEPHPPIHAWLATLFFGGGAGLVEMMAVCRRGLGGRVAAAILLALVPALAWQASALRLPPRLTAHEYGHDTLSVESLGRVLAAVPSGSSLVSEDAASNILVRATGRFDVFFTAREPAAIAAALATRRRVFALPAAESDLETLGYRLIDGATAGLAEVTASSECRPATSEWRTAVEWSTSLALSLVARTPQEAGPVVIYAGFEAKPVLAPVGWPDNATRGFYTTVYDLSSVDGREHLAQDVRDDAVGREVAGSHPFVARLELWRTPTAPLRLTVDLGAQPQDVLARVIARAEPRRLLLCPTFRHTVRPFAG